MLFGEGGKMQLLRWMIAALLVVGAFSATQDQGKVKRQLPDCTIRFGPNQETIFVCNGRDAVYLTGNNAKMFNIMAGETLLFSESLGVLIIEPERIGPFPNIRGYSFRRCGTISPDVEGPGKLYTSEGLAFFTSCQRDIDQITNIIATTIPLAVDVRVEPVMDMGMQFSQLVVNNDFRLTITGAEAITLGSTSDQRVTYMGDTLTVGQGSEQQVFTGITMFGTLTVPSGSMNLVFSVLNGSTTTETFQGPGQLYVGDDAAFFADDTSFLFGGSDITESINTQVFEQTFVIRTTGNTVTVENNMNMPITVLSSDTSTVNLPTASTVTYSGSQSGGNVDFVDTSGRSTTFSGIQMFSVFDNNELRTFTTMGSPEIQLGGGGGVTLIDTVGRTAVYLSNTNMAAVSQLGGLIPASTTASYDVVTNTDGLRLLTVTSATMPPVTQTVQTVTGNFVTGVGPLQSVNYDNGEVVIENAAGNPVLRIEDVDRLVVNTEDTPFAYFNGSSPLPFSGPGTLSYNRGTAFFTTNPSLGSTIRFQSATAPIPDIDFDRVDIRVMEIDGVNYTVSGVTQTIGGDRVITYEASSFSTSPGQEILYSGSTVTVHEPIRAGSGSVSFNGGMQTVTYTDTSGNSQTIAGIDTFSDFSGGDITTTLSPSNRTVQGPGKLYVSRDGTEVFFSSTDIVTSPAANLIRQGETVFSVDADQFSSISGGRFDLSTDSGIRILPGGGTIWSRTFDGIEESFYVDDEGVSDEIRRAVSTLLTLTKSEPIKDMGILRIIFNGRELYDYSPVPGSRDVFISNTETFFFNGTALVGASLPGGPYTNINKVISFDGIEMKEFNSSDAPVDFSGPGLLLVNVDSDTAFYTTSPTSLNYLLQSISILREFLISPKIMPATDRQVTTKLRSSTFQFGTDVNAFEGSDITFECIVQNGRPEPSITFFRVIDEMTVMPLEMEMGIEIMDNKLTIMNIDIDDSGVYRCSADNGVPPAATADSTLTVRNAVAPQVQPGWFPFNLQSRQRIFWPSNPQTDTTVEIQTVDELVFACRVEGRPKAEVIWTVNDLDVASGMSELVNFTITEVSEGRSVLIVDVSKDSDDEFLFRGENRIECSASNRAGATSGMLNLRGINYFCTDDVIEGPCSRTCGFGIRDLTFTCTKLEAGRPPVPDVDNSEVPDEALPRPERFEICTTSDPDGNPFICPLTEFRWNASEWSECSKSCNGGTRNRAVDCLELTIPITNLYRAELDRITETVLNDSVMCEMFDAAGERPASEELCNEQSCPFWKAGQYSECSVTCGGGVRMRSVTCYILNGQYIDMVTGKVKLNLTEVDGSQCNNETKPQESIMGCNDFKCLFEWRAARQFGECGDVALPDEFKFCRQRRVYCHNADPAMDVEVNDSYCADKPRPQSLQSCGGGSCFTGIWETLPWSACSETCGYGTQTRSLQCRSPTTLTLVSNDFCDSGKRPPTIQQCFVQNCANRCLRDEIAICETLANLMMCNSPIAMGGSGLRCCVSCMGMAGGD